MYYTLIHLMLTITVGRNQSTEWFNNLPNITQQRTGGAKSPQGKGPTNKPHPGAKNTKNQLASYSLILK